MHVCMSVRNDPWVAVAYKLDWTNTLFDRAQELCESRGNRPGLLVPTKPRGFCWRKATLNQTLFGGIYNNYQGPMLVLSQKSWFVGGFVCSMISFVHRRRNVLTESRYVVYYSFMNKFTILQRIDLELGLESPVFLSASTRLRLFICVHYSWTVIHPQSQKLISFVGFS